MPQIEGRDVKRIFYFNINYNCNNRCVFCYSHNTVQNKQPLRQISFENFTGYLSRSQVSSHDRVILNGGEPLMHRELPKLLGYLQSLGCEVLIYTNGKLLKQLPLGLLSKRFRVIVPVHGCGEVHDQVTGAAGSCRETIDAMAFFSQNAPAPLDLKIIIHPGLIQSEASFQRSLETLQGIPYTGALHLTKMADTLVSRRNLCPSVDLDTAGIYTKRIFDTFRGRENPIKLYDTCIRYLDWLSESKLQSRAEDRIVFSGIIIRSDPSY